jgi:hemoglobin/transferrin/lactoferrin receptor protein
MLTIFFVLFSVLVYGQEILVISEQNGQAIEQVLLTNQNQNKTAVSNHSGVIDLSAFNAQDSLIFHHATFYDYSISYSKALKQKVIQLHPKQFKLKEVVISASKWEENIQEIPNKIEKLDSKAIELSNPQTSADLLKNTAGVYIQKSQMGGGSPMIRGFAANSILLMFDGVRLNNSIYRSGNLQNIITIDPFSLQSSEVIFGPGAIVYGSDALGGVIDFHSKEIVLDTSDRLKAQGQVLSRYSSSNQEKTGHIDFSVTKGKWGSFSSISYSNFDDQIMGNIGPSEYERLYYVERVNNTDQIVVNNNPNKQVYSGYSQLNLLQKIKFQANKDLSFDYSFYYTKSSDIPRYDRLIQMNVDHLKYAEWYYGPQEWMVNSLKVNSNKVTPLWDGFKFQFSNQGYKESRINRKFESTDLKSRKESLKISSLNADFNKKFSPDFFFFYGLEASSDHLKSTAFSKDITTNQLSPLSTRYPDGKNTYQTLAAYSAFRYKVKQKMDISGGLRYSFVKIHSSFNDKSFYPFNYDNIDLQNGALTANFGLVYQASKNTRFNTNLSSGFRSPNIDDIAKVFDSEPGSVVVPNPNLKPEYVYNIDFGWSQAFFNKKLNTEMVAFYSYLDQAMVRGDFSINGLTTLIYDGQESNIQAIVNTGFARIYGFTFQWNYRLNEFLFWKNNLSLVKGHDNNGYSIRHAPPLYGNSSLSFEREQWTFMLNAYFSSEIAYADLAPTEAAKPYLYAQDENGKPYAPAWYTLDFKTNYRLSSSLSFQFELINLMDKRYRTYSSGIAAPGRSIRFSLSYRFN